MITKEDFETWQANPVTQEVLRWVRRHADEAKATWDKESWGHGKANAALLTELRTRAEIASDFADVELSDIQEESDEQKHVGASAPRVQRIGEAEEG